MSCYLHHPLKYYGKCKNNVGKGVYGFVRKYINKETGEVYAVKIHEELTSMIREVDVLMKCKDETSIIDILDIGYDSHRGKYYHVMPLAKCNMFERIEKEYFMDDPDKHKHAFHQIVQGIHALHRRGLMHRDIKAENVLCMDDEKYVLCDFGLSKTAGIEGQCYSTNVCTPCYRPPENHAKCESYSYGIDIWSLACLFCEMILGDIPFDEESLENVWAVFGKREYLRQFPYFVKCEEYLSEKSFKRRDYKSIWKNNFIEPIREKCGEDAVDLLNSMFCIDPDQRISTLEMLLHPYFTKIDIPKEIQYPFYVMQDWTSNQNKINWNIRNTLFLHLYEVARDRRMISRSIFKAYNLINYTLNHPSFKNLDRVDFLIICIVILDLCSKLYGCETFNKNDHTQWIPNNWKELDLETSKTRKRCNFLERKLLHEFQFQIFQYIGYEIFWNDNITTEIENYPNTDFNLESQYRFIYKLLIFNKEDCLNKHPKNTINKIIENKINMSHCKDKIIPIILNGSSLNKFKKTYPFFYEDYVEDFQE